MLIRFADSLTIFADYYSGLTSADANDVEIFAEVSGVSANGVESATGGAGAGVNGVESADEDSEGMPTA